jgi:hypothetical protein
MLHCESSFLHQTRCKLQLIPFQSNHKDIMRGSEVQIIKVQLKYLELHNSTCTLTQP